MANGIVRANARSVTNTRKGLVDVRGTLLLLPPIIVSAAKEEEEADWEYFREVKRRFLRPPLLLVVVLDFRGVDAIIGLLAELLACILLHYYFVLKSTSTCAFEMKIQKHPRKKRFWAVVPSFSTTEWNPMMMSSSALCYLLIYLPALLNYLLMVQALSKMTCREREWQRRVHVVCSVHESHFELTLEMLCQIMPT